MKMDRIVELRPKDGSADAIHASIEEASRERTLAEERIRSMEADRGRLLMEGTAKEIQANEDAIQQLAVLMGQIDALIEALAQPLQAALKAEQLAALRKQYDDLGYQKRCDAFVAFWRDEYPAHAAAIAAGMLLEQEALSVFQSATRLHALLERAGCEVDAPVPPAWMAAGRLQNTRELGSLVRLPGVFGAPFVPLEWVTEQKKRYVEMPRFGENDPYKEQPIGISIVEKLDDVRVPKFAAEDKPFWPVNGKDWKKQ